MNSNDEVTLPIEDPQPAEKQKGLVPRSILLWVGLFLVVVLGGFFMRDILTATAEPEKKAVPAEVAASAVDLGVAPSPDDIRRAAKAATEKPQPMFRPEGQWQEQPQVQGAASAPGNDPLVAPTITRPDAGTIVKHDPRSTATTKESPSLAQRGFGVPSEADFEKAQALAEAQVRVGGSTLIALRGEGEAATASAGISAALNKSRDVAGMGDHLPMPDASSGTADALKAMQLAMSAANGKPEAALQSRDVTWLKEYGKEQPEFVEATRVNRLDPRRTVLQGTRIPVVALEAINSDLPGQITARSTRDILDSLGQNTVLIPRQTRFVGSYSSEIKPGQRRILFAFNRAILPDGRSINLTSAQGVDNVGRAGVDGEVDNHFMTQFGHSLAIAVLSTQIPNKGPSSTTNNGSSSSTTTVAAQVLSDVAAQIMGRNRNIPPTIEREIAAPFFITLSSDVVLDFKGEQR